MARPPRVQVGGGVYHITARGAVRQMIFRQASDPEHFLGIFAAVVEHYDWCCHGFCLMPTHYHLLVRTPNPDLARGMQRLNGHYAQGFNQRHGGSGHVFESRYYSLLVEREGHLLELYRYLALNPVRAGLCSTAADWQWGSYRAALGMSQAPPYLAVEWLLAHFGTNRGRARERLRAFVEDGA